MAEFDTNRELLTDTARIAIDRLGYPAADTDEVHLHESAECIVANNPVPIINIPVRIGLTAILSLPSSLNIVSPNQAKLKYDIKYALTYSEDHEYYDAPVYGLAAYHDDTGIVSTPFAIPPGFQHVGIGRMGLSMQASDWSGRHIMRRDIAWSHAIFSRALAQARDSNYISKEKHVAIEMQPDKLTVKAISRYGARLKIPCL